MQYQEILNKNEEFKWYKQPDILMVWFTNVFRDTVLLVTTAVGNAGLENEHSSG